MTAVAYADPAPPSTANEEALFAELRDRQRELAKRFKGDLHGFGRALWDVRAFCAWDSETHLITPTVQAPPMVCASVAVLRPLTPGADPPVPTGYRAVGRLLLRDGAPHEGGSALDLFERLVDDDSVVLVGANLAFDLVVAARHRPHLLRRIRRKLDLDLCYDVLIGQAEDAIAGGYLTKDPDGSDMPQEPGKPRDKGGAPKRYSLWQAVRIALGRYDAKANDEWKLRYVELDGVPLEQWPETARQYPVDDAVNTLLVAVAQVTGWDLTAPTEPKAIWAPQGYRNLSDVAEQCRSALALHLASVEGLPVDQGRVEAYEAENRKVRSVAQRDCLEAGFLYLNSTKRDLALIGYPRKWKADEATPDEAMEAIERARAFNAGHCPPADGAVEYDAEGRPIPQLDVQLSKDTRAIKRRVLQLHGGEPCPPGEHLDRGCERCAGTGIAVPVGVLLTETGGVSTKREEVLEDLANLDPDVRSLATLGRTEKAETTYIPYLRKADPTVHPRVNVLLETGRCSYEGVLHQAPKKGPFRSCFHAGPGRSILTSDWVGVELVTWSQVCIWILGYSTMGEAIVSGVDIHAELASEIMNGRMAWQEIKRLAKLDGNSEPGRMRQASKSANFMFPGGGGELRFVAACKKDGIILCRYFGHERCNRVVEHTRDGTPVPVCEHCLQVARNLRRSWRAKWREAQHYLDTINEMVNLRPEQPVLVPNAVAPLGAARIRGGVGFNDGANGYFQSLAAIGMKRALWRLTRECWEARRGDPLYRSKPVFTMQDEFLISSPTDRAADAGPAVERIMVEEMQAVVPDVARGVKVEWKSMTYWQK